MQFVGGIQLSGFLLNIHLENSTIRYYLNYSEINYWRLKMTQILIAKSGV
ncbi:hypothetical protein SAMN03080598_04277 [Algoriphagus boritolerans DSM 17298 = JCM 18970]|uniref:Uncharacterized protein n=1 Tax=Algoriphagus boritolerans DSM 17298 = JCM 18970 TaxID=1120964 RepID=A0A1H6ARQ6_9BACT|nr:hypothetical protein SAMN03080598_04277 [Algoriphagus boritolerans DSM 17298 = JCM 18970]